MIVRVVWWYHKGDGSMHSPPSNLERLPMVRVGDYVDCDGIEYMIMRIDREDPTEIVVQCSELR